MALKVKSGETLQVTVDATEEAEAMKLVEDIQALLRG
jgi:phosphotransferase system HPr-like phosphotransfer protein